MALFETERDYGPAAWRSGLTGPDNDTQQGDVWARPTFRDCAAADIGLAFFNLDEHAERHLVDGKDVPCVLEEVDVRHYNAHWEWGKKGSMDDGLYLAHYILYVRAQDYGPKPKAGRMLVMDGGTEEQRSFRILQCREEQGVYRITMERARQ